MAGLATRSKAPSARASTARAPWAGEKAETTTTGTARARPSRSARSTPRPSRPGIAGRASARPAGGAAQRERLVAVGGGADDVEALAAERVGQHAAHEPGVVGDDDARRSPRWRVRASGSGRGGSSSAGGGEAALGVEQDDQAVVDLRDRLDRVGVGGRDALELVVVTVRTSSTSSTMTPTWPAPVSTMTILPGSVAARRAEARGEVEDRDDLAAQADDAADPGTSEATERGS